MFKISVQMQGMSEEEQSFDLSHVWSYNTILFGLYLKKYIPNSSIEFHLTEKYNILGVTESQIQDLIKIENSDTGNYILIDFQDSPFYSSKLLGDAQCKALYASMYENGTRYVREGEEKYHPFFFFDQQPHFHKNYLPLISLIRKNKENLLPKMVFYGGIGDEKLVNNHLDYDFTPPRPTRQVLRNIEKQRPDLIDIFNIEKGNATKGQWWINASTYILTVTAPGCPWTYREIECNSLGIATIANTYTASLPYPYIGNTHYVDAGTTGIKTKQDVEVDADAAAELIINRFLEVREDFEFITNIEKRAKERYVKHASVKPASKYIKDKVIELLI